MSLDKALDVLSGHSSFDTLQGIPDFNTDSLASLAGIRDKVAAGRYRGARAFVADVQFMLSKLTSKKSGDAAELKAELTAFFTTFLEGRLSQ